MLIFRGTEFKMHNGCNGINVRRDTNFAAWNMSDKMEIERLYVCREEIFNAGISALFLILMIILIFAQ